MNEFGYPQMPQAFLDNQDLFYSQFNDVEFYVEDIEQENFYLRILRRLFPNISISKIFPLGGKGPLIQSASVQIGNNKKVFIADLDFDEILNKRISQENLFYLDAYSIENYLLEEKAILEIVKEEKPKLKDDEVFERFNFKSFLLESFILFKDITKLFLVIQKYQLGIRNVDHDAAYFCNLNVVPAHIRNDVWEAYIGVIKRELDTRGIGNNYEDIVEEFEIWFQDYLTSLKNIPGKYLIKLLKAKIEHVFSLASINLDSFIYRLSGHCVLDDLNFLKTDIAKYIFPKSKRVN